MVKVVSVGEMRQLERSSEAIGLPGPALMENAGRAIAQVVADRYPRPLTSRVLVLAGPGNNGGDGLVTARHLHDAGYRVTTYLVNRARVGDAKDRLLTQRQVNILDLSSDSDFRCLDLLLRDTDLVVDALLGTGRSRPIEDPMAGIFRRLNSATRLLTVSVDLPSGVNADTGEADPLTLHAALTVSLSNPKRGLLFGPASGYVGKLVNVDIGVPQDLSDALSVRYADNSLISRALPRRSRISHKGSFGRILIVAGSRLYTGAPVLAALGAARVGAGLVTLACPESIRPSLAAHTLETTFLPLPDDGLGELVPRAIDSLADRLTEYDAVLLGPGIGRSKSTEAFLKAFLAMLGTITIPTIIDADALTLLSAWPNFWERLPYQSILTPHAGEMSRLLGHEVGVDRITAASEAANNWRTIIVLKGAYSVVAVPNHDSTVMPFANPALATAGTGDVLGGAILGLLGQGATPPDSAIAGVYLHGLAGEYLANDRGLAGGLASEVAENLPRARRAVEAV